MEMLAFPCERMRVRVLLSKTEPACSSATVRSDFYGAEGQNRTDDTALFRRLLYH